MFSLNEFSNLPQKAQKQLINSLKFAYKSHFAPPEKPALPNVICPACSSKKISRNGKSPSGKERYLCNTCHRSFSETTGTPVHAIKNVEKFYRFFDEMCRGYRTLNQMSRIIGISVSTAFEWRHKILNAMVAVSKKYDGITDLNPGVVPFSRKGLKSVQDKCDKYDYKTNILAVGDYRENSELTVLSVGDLKASHFPSELYEKLSGNAIVIAPWKRQLTEYSKAVKIGFTLFRPDLKNNRFDVRQADKLHAGLNHYVRKQMRGVSTKYLHEYSEWVDRISGVKKRSMESWKMLLKNQFAWGRYVNREDFYRKFMQTKSEADYIKSLNREWKTAGKYDISRLFGQA